MTNYAVVGLGYGDEGKGATVDHLCRTRDVGLVVRHNGGAQAGHNVVTDDGRHHTFSQWGSGTLAGVPTFLSRFTVVDPLALEPEAEHLRSVGVEDPWSMLTIDPDALVVTPWHRAAQRFDEVLRGKDRHGTCGMGIGKAVEESLKYPDRALRWKHLAEATDPGRQEWDMVRFMRLRFQEHSLASIEDADGEYPWARQPDEVAGEFLSVAQRVRPSMGFGTAARQHGPVVFEGAQGVLLDEWYGFHPHTTWSTTTFANADTLSREIGVERPYRIGVTRSYSLRHGPGPFPTEDGWRPTDEPHNGHDDWRGDVRYGPLDLVLLRYAVEVCGGIDGVALTHLDAPLVPPVRELMTPLGSVFHVPVPRTRDLDRQEALGRALTHSTSGACALPAGVTHNVQEVTGAPVIIESHGPTSADRTERVGVTA